MPFVPEDTVSFPAAKSSQGNQNVNDSQDKKGPAEKSKAKAQDFISKGPQIPNGEFFLCLAEAGKLTYEYPFSEMPPKASREETDRRMKELNK